MKPQATAACRSRQSWRAVVHIPQLGQRTKPGRGPCPCTLLRVPVLSFAHGQPSPRSTQRRAPPPPAHPPQFSPLPTNEGRISLCCPCFRNLIYPSCCSLVPVPVYALSRMPAPCYVSLIRADSAACPHAYAYAPATPDPLPLLLSLSHLYSRLAILCCSSHAPLRLGSPSSGAPCLVRPP